MLRRVKILTKVWLIFFLCTIGLIGVSLAVLFYFPLLFLAKFWPGLRVWHEQILCQGIRFLMFVQPWLKADVAVQVPRLDSRGVLFISNHRSHLDVFMLFSRIPGIRILAKASLFQIPFLALMMRASGQIKVPRGRLDAWVRAMDEVKLRLRLGQRVHIFPEMTRCEQGFAGVQPFAAGPFLAALQEDAMVVPLVIQGTDAVWPKGYLGLRFGQPVRMRTLPPIRAREFASAEQLKVEVHKQIEQALL